MPRNRFFVWICLTLLSYLFPLDSAYANPVVIVNTRQHHLQVIGNQNHRQSNPAGAQMLRDFALAMATNPINIKPLFQCAITTETQASSRENTIIWVRIEGAQMKGDVALKGFDISDVLLPSLFDAIVLAKTSTGDTIFSEKLVAQRLVQGSTTQIKILFDPTQASDSVLLEIKDPFFYHESRDVTRLLARIQKIADYYAADYLLNQIQTEFADINCRQYDLLPQCFLTLLKADRALSHMAEAKFYEFLSLGLSDPTGLHRRLEIALNTYSFLMREFSNTLRQTNRIYLTLTEEELIMQYLQGIIDHMADNPEPGFASAPFINQLANLNYKGQKFEVKAGYFRKLASLINPGMPAEEASAHFLNLAYETMLSKAKSYISEVEFNKAIVLLENAARFCEAFRELNCSDEAYFELSKARYGLFGFYLSVADDAIELERPDIAESYVFRAKEYQKTYNHLIIYDGSVITRVIKLFDAWVLQATRHNLRANHDSALLILRHVIEPRFGITPSASWHAQNIIALNGVFSEKLNRFHQTLNAGPIQVIEENYNRMSAFISLEMHGVTMYPENRELLFSLQRDFIVKLVNAAINDFQEEYFEESMRKILFVRNMPVDQSIKLIPLIDSLSPIVGRKIIDRMLEQAVVLMNQGKTVEGSEQYNIASERTEIYGLQDDKATTARFEEVYNAHFAFWCAGIQKKLDQAVAEAHTRAGQKKFLMAVDSLSAEIFRFKNFKACRLKAENASAFIERHQPAADYQYFLQLASRALEEENYLESIRHIEQANNLYSDNNLLQFEIEPFTMIDFAEAANDNTLNYYIAGHFVQLQNYPNALHMLEMLRKAGVSRDEASQIQQDLGKSMGFEDRNKVSFLKSFSQAKKYTSKSSWYRPFNKAYRKGLGHKFPWFF